MCFNKSLQENKAADSFQVPCLGIPFQLGMPYDCYCDNIIIQIRVESGLDNPDDLGRLGHISFLMNQLGLRLNYLDMIQISGVKPA